VLSDVQYPHWLMVAGALLVLLGFVGLAFRKSSAEPDQEVVPPEERAQLSSRPTGRPPEFLEDRVNRSGSKK
jgi:hypothetical protein